MKELKEKTGITLIALVITIIVLLILAGVAIATLTGDNGLLQRAGEVKNKNAEVIAMEKIQVEVAGSYGVNGKSDIEQLNNNLKNINGLKYYNNELSDENKITKLPVVVELDENFFIINENGKTEKIIPIEKEKSYVGCYADIDADGNVDGVIYADLANNKSGAWKGVNYKIDAVNILTDLKGYYISQKNYEGKFGIENVLSSYGDGKDRFYVMALNDIDSNAHTWYKNARMADYATATSVEFGKGRENTEYMMEKWSKGTIEEGGYGEQSSNDIWGFIEEDIKSGWFIPSKGEWAAFADFLANSNPKLNKENFNSVYGLSYWYWSSSQHNSYGPFDIRFEREDMMGYVEANYHKVRLATIF